MSRTFSIAIIVLVTKLIVSSSSVAQTTCYVDDDAPNDLLHGDPSVSDPQEDGSPEHPFDAIQECIDVSTTGDTMLVRDGTYTGDGNRDMDFGGRLITLRSQNGPDACIIDCQATSSNSHRAFNFISGESSSAVLEGFTIKNGYVNSDSGGAIYIGSNGSPTIGNCAFRNNTAAGGAVQHTGKGGAIYIDSNGAATTIRGCTFIANTAVAGTVAKTGSGGAIALLKGAVTVTDSEFRNNMAIRMGGLGGYGGHGGAIGTRISELTLSGCRFIDNLADSADGADGGALTCHSEPGIDEWNNTTISHCLFVGNRATYEGGAIRNGKSDILISNSVFAGNRINYAGAAVFMAYPGPNGPARMINTIVAGNHTAGVGATVGHFSGPARKLEIVNCAIVYNEGDRGGISNSTGVTGSLMSIANSVVWGNVPVQMTSDPDANTTVTYTCFENGASEPWFSAGCIEDDPLFVAGPTGSWTSDATYSAETGQATFFDSTASWQPGSLTNLFLNPDVSQVLQSVVVTNSEDSITVWGDFADLGTNGAMYQVSDYRVLPASPVINAGSNGLLPPDTLDLDGDGDSIEAIPIDGKGHTRVLCSTVDMGPYEFGIGDFDCSRSVNLVDFGNWPACMTGPDGGPYGAGCEVFDFEFDDDVDARDFAGFQAVFMDP